MQRKKESFWEIILVAGLCICAIAWFTRCSTAPKPAPPVIESPVVEQPKDTEVVVAPPMVPGEGMKLIQTSVVGSKCSKYAFKDRGVLPIGYYKGMALSFAKALCRPNDPDVKLVSMARKLPESAYDGTDSLSWYNSNFRALGMYNDTAGPDTLRHVYALMTGLGARESSGKYCCGRDLSADYIKETSAEAGTFQGSYGSKGRAPEILGALFKKYTADQSKCMRDVWKEGVKKGSMNHDQYCATQAKNWGDPDSDGYAWQRLTKACPAFSAEWNAVLMRTTAGSKGEFGPMRRKEVELRKECDDMYFQVQSIVEANPAVCKEF